MATTPRRARTPRARTTSLVLTTIAAIAAFASTPAVAQAATPAPNYTTRQAAYQGGQLMQVCRGWGGDADDAGHFYMGCPVMRDLDGNGTGDVVAPALYELDTNGQVVRLGYLPSEYHFSDRYHIRDVGVSPDGTAAYVSVGPAIDNLGKRPDLNPYTSQPLGNGATAGSLLRLTRQADGSWVHDPSFKAGPYLLGDNHWSVRYVDVDARGHVYVTVNAYVYELDPATGQRISVFGGGETAYPGGPWVEGIETPQGISVSADGSSILVVEQRHQIVQRWNRVGATDWIRDRGFLLGVPDQVGDYCASNAHFQSPYDVGTDAAGDIYVMDTTCQRIQRFTAAGAYVQTVWNNAGGDDLNHGFGVNWQGSILLPIEEDVLVRLDPPRKPEPPKPAPAPPVDGGGGGTAKPVAAKVRPFVRIAGRGCSRVAPFRRLANARRYRVVDRCARISGRVVGISRTRTGYRIRMLVPAGTARRIWFGSPGARRIDILTDRRTRILRTVRSRHGATVVASVVATRSRTGVWIMPADAIAGRR